MIRKIERLLAVLIVTAAVGVALAGCANHSEHPTGSDHPKSEHPTSEHPEHPK